MKIRELFHLIHHLPFSKMKEHNLLHNRKDKADQLFKLIKTEKVTNDKIAIQFLFPTHQSPVKALYKTKQRLISRIINELLLLNHSSFPSYTKANLAAYKGLVSYKIAKLLGLRKLFEYVAQLTLKKALTNHITEVNVSIAKELIMHYAYQGKEEQRAYYETILNEQAEWLNVEFKLTSLYAQLLVIIQSKKAYSNKDKIAVETLLHKAQQVPYAPTYQAVLFNAYHQSICFEFLKQYVKATQICQDALHKIDQMDFESPRTGLVMLKLRMIPGLIINKQFVQADILIDQLLEMYRDKNTNWLAVKSYQVFNSFHSGNFEKSWSITQEIRDKDSSWKMYEAYAAILNARPLKKSATKLSSDFYKDKMGMNINLIIIDFLNLLVQGRTSEIIDKTDALTQYMYRYLQSEGTLRSQLFIKMLLSISKGNFEVSEMDQLVTTHLEELQQHTLSNYAQDFEVEIVPYELLWEEIRTVCEKI